MTPSCNNRARVPKLESQLYKPFCIKASRLAGIIFPLNSTNLGLPFRFSS